MKGLAKVTIAVAALAGTAIFGGASANAQGFAVGVGPGGINFSYSSGGYCDDYGCPNAFWDMPVYYCPVFYRGDWFRGPVYYRQTQRGPQFWVRGGWRYDQWRGPRPPWACSDRFGPARGFDFYDHDRRFRMRDEWRRQGRRDHGGPNGPNYNGPGDDGPGGPGFGPDRSGPGGHDIDRHQPGLNLPFGIGKHNKHGNSGADNGPGAGGQGAPSGQNTPNNQSNRGASSGPSQGGRGAAFGQNKPNNQANPGASNGPAGQGGGAAAGNKPNKPDKGEKRDKGDHGPDHGSNP